MGFVLLLIGIIGIFPFSAKLRESPKLTAATWMAIGFGLFLYPAIPQFGIMIRGDASWPGHTKGFEVSLVDLALWAYLLSIRGLPKGPKPPFILGMKFFFAACVISALLAGTGSIGFYYVFQLLRMYLVFRAVAHAAQNEVLFSKLLDGLCYGLILEIIAVLYEKFVMHVPQPYGTFGHQNILGVTSNLLLITIITPLFGHRGKALRYVAVASAILIPALIASRGTAMLGLGGVAVSYLLSLMRGTNSRKLQFGILGLIVTAILVPVALASFEGRFKGEDWAIGAEKGYDEREAYKKAAREMISDHPMGVGPNYFVLIANTDGYYKRAGVLMALSSLAGHVHNIYYLTTAEVGWLGLAALLFMFSVPLVKGFSAARKLKDSIDGDYVGAITVALFFCYLHSTYEWMLVMADPQYTLSLVYGLLAALLIKNRAVLSAAPATVPVRDAEFSPARVAMARKKVGF